MALDCDKLGWDPLGSAPLHSAFAGVLAGLVFAGIVLLLSVQAERIRRANALVVLGSAFLVLAFDAFMFGVIAGERVCGRAWTETMFAAGLLGLGALGIFSGLCWLIDANDSGDRRTTRFYLSITYVIALIASYHIAVTAHDYLADVAPYADIPRWLIDLVRIYEWTLVGLVLLTIAINVLRRRLRRLAVGVSHRFVINTAYAYVGCVVVSAYMSGRSAMVPEKGWEHVGSGTMAWNAIVSLVLPGFAILAQLWALPFGQSVADPPVAD